LLLLLLLLLLFFGVFLGRGEGGYSHTSNFFSCLAAVTIADEKAVNLDLCLVLSPFNSESSFTCHTCCDTTSAFSVSSEGSAPTSHSGIRTRDARIIRAGADPGIFRRGV
jgi:hypothetical protein